MPAVIKGGPADLIAHAWFCLGFRPADSLVLIGLLDRRTGPVVRADLPPAKYRRSVVRSTLDPLRSYADAVVALVIRTGGWEEARSITRALRAEARRHAIAVVDVLLIDGDRYRSALCTDSRCCPPGGKPLAEVMQSAAAAAHVVAGDLVASSESGIVDDVMPDPAATADREDDGQAAPLSTAEWFAQWDWVLGGADWPEAGLRVPFARALRDAALRDAVLASIAGDEAAASSLAARQEWTGPLFELPPDARRMERARDVLAAVARAAPAGARAEVLAVLAWMAWHSGSGGARARLLVGLALADTPGHRLALLVDQLLLAAVPPGWWPAADGRVSISETGYPPMPA